MIDPRLTWASIDIIKKNGGIPVVTSPGMTRVPKRMREENVPFGGELSSHFYFRETFYRDNGILPLLLILQMMSRDQKPLSAYYIPLEGKYFISGELNFEVADASSLLKAAEELYRDGKIEYIDGLSVEYSDWRFNLRPSNTEPLVRLNIEAKNPALVKEKEKELKEFIAAHAKA
jgi:phosphomannomutase